MAKAVEWGVAAFRAAGVDVHTEKYTLPVAWSEGETRLELLGPVQFPVSLVSEGLVAGDARGRNGSETRRCWLRHRAGFCQSWRGGQRRDSAGAQRNRLNLGRPCSRNISRPPAIINRAVNGGAFAILWMGARERKLLYRHTNALNGQIDSIPQAVVAREDAMRLARTVAAYPGKMRVRLTMPNKIGGPIEQENVVGEIRGYEKPDEIVILGAHLDSWELGTGALDNGCNAALVIEAARAIKATGLLAAAHHSFHPVQRRRTGHDRLVRIREGASRRDGQNPRDDHLRHGHRPRDGLFAGRSARHRSGHPRSAEAICRLGREQSHVRRADSAPTISISCSKACRRSWPIRKTPTTC